jgi:hypothetical protein
MRGVFERFADERRVISDRHLSGEDSQYLRALADLTEAPSELVISPAGAALWLSVINGGLRGSEYKLWLTLSERQVDRCLIFEQWVEIAINELKAGKWWAVAHDMRRCDVPWPTLNNGQSHLHQERLDHVVFGGKLTPLSWCQSPLCDELEQYYLDQRPLPHRDHPSDHLPVQATFLID